MTASETGRLLEPLLRARRFDEGMLRLAPDIRGHFHVSIGFEATAVALAVARRERDLVSTTYRNHAHLAALGSDVAVMFAEVLGRDLGHQRGRSGSIHLSDPDVGLLHTSAMVSAGVPLAAGLAFALRRNAPGAVCFACFGDGAVGEGGVHETLNIAALWELPILFVCENNAPPAEDRANDYQAAPSLVALAQANSIPGADVDARDTESTVETFARLTEEVRGGAGPRFLDAHCPRWPGSEGFWPRDATGATDLTDAAGTRGERWFDDNDPVLREARRLLRAGVSMEDLLAVDERVRREIDAAIGRARAAPVPPAEAAMTDVVGPP